MQKFQADWVYPVSTPPIKNGIIITDDDGTIRDVLADDAHAIGDVQKYHGTITPGFVNTHCHLELSHMKGLMNTGTGLISFINDVVRKRSASTDVITQAIKDAEDEW